MAALGRVCKSGANEAQLALPASQARGGSGLSACDRRSTPLDGKASKHRDGRNCNHALALLNFFASLGFPFFQDRLQSSPKNGLGLLYLLLSIGCTDGLQSEDVEIESRLAAETMGDVDAAKRTLRFATFGDTRPADYTVGSPYPVAVVESIFRAIDRQAVDFVILTGDYIFVNGKNPRSAAAQLDLLLTARKQLSSTVPVYYVLGNHEDKNISTFQAKLSTELYWRFDFEDAKFVAIANDVWDSAQAAWLQTQLRTPTRYTFVFRHQYWGSHGTLHDAEIHPIVKAHPYTLFIAGHDHVYKRKPAITRGERRDVVAGNGGAPFDHSWHPAYYGYLLVEKQPDGRVSATSYKVEPGMDIPPVAMENFSVAP